MADSNLHSADDSALGFLYQGQYALLALWRERDDDAVVWVETLDDVVLTSSSGETILEQLKHSMKVRPASLTLASRNLWKTIKAWIDIFPVIQLEHTWFHLVVVGDISKQSPLQLLLEDGNDRSLLLQELEDEAKRVQQDRREAELNGKTPLPHADRASGCDAFLGLSQGQRKAFLGRIKLKRNQPNIAAIEAELATSMTTLLAHWRPVVARQLLDWWNGQILDLMAKTRTQGISRGELLTRYSEIFTTLKMDELSAKFSTVPVPPTYAADRMLLRQIKLVGGTDVVIRRLVQWEWRARQERSSWIKQNPAHMTTISNYDMRLVEEWDLQHTDMCQEVSGKDEVTLVQRGFEILRWSERDAPTILEPIGPKILSLHYVRGAYQILSITGEVGWHPEYRLRLGFS